jgi:putative transposon-encoded protein
MIENKWNIEDVEFKGRAYKKVGKVVCSHPSHGFILVSKKLIGKKVTVIVIPEDELNIDDVENVSGKDLLSLADEEKL